MNAMLIQDHMPNQFIENAIFPFRKHKCGVWVFGVLRLH